MGFTILPTLVRSSVDGHSAGATTLRSVPPRHPLPPSRRGRPPPSPGPGMGGRGGGRTLAPHPPDQVQGVHARGGFDQPDRPCSRGGGPPSRPPPELRLTHHLALDSRGRRSDRER